MDRFYSRRTRKFIRSQDFTNWAQDHINRQTVESRGYKVTQSDVYNFQVARYGKSSAVDLMSEKCSCGEFQDLKLPFRHAIAAIAYGRYSIGAYINDVYMQKTYYDTYKASFPPIDTRDLEMDKNCKPCSFKTPKVVRKRSAAGMEMVIIFARINAQFVEKMAIQDAASIAQDPAQESSLLRALDR
jgi:hypothetical protein